VGSGHGIDRDFQPDLFSFDGGADGITEVDLGDFLLGVGEDSAVLAFTFDLS